MLDDASELTRLHMAIDALEAQRSTLGDAVVESALGPLREKLATLDAQGRAEPQRKQATILFADATGFTTLSETIDAEVVAGLMNDLWVLVDEAILTHGGHIDKHIGDAVMALWGVEQAREDDPERSVRAALAIQAAVDAFCTSHNTPLALRIGVHTGPVLLGAVGTTAEFTAIGDAVNVANRLEHACPVGGVLISHDVYRHVRGVFDIRPQEPIAVKGKAEPLKTYIVQRAKPRAFRMATRGVEGIETRMVGRDNELNMLRDAYADAFESSETRVVTIVGEAGVGKSRLLYEFDNWVELRPETIWYFKGRGTPNTMNVPHSLFRDLFTFRFEILDSDSATTALEKFRRGMVGVLAPSQADVVGHWLGFDFSASEAVRQLLGGGDMATIGRAYLTRHFQELTRTNPVILLLEDLHWGDDASLDLVIHLARALPGRALLVVCTGRPIFLERRAGWGEGEAAFRRVHLKPLSRRASRALVDEILQRVDEVSDELRNLIIDAAEGNPFYVEEMVKMLLDQGVIERDAVGAGFKPAPTEVGWRVRTDKLAGLRVPPTLMGLLQARLDGLPRPEREVLQRASVVGRLFWDEAIAEVAQMPITEIRPLLEASRGRELIFRRERSSFVAVEEYIFKHALLRDVAYETVLLKHRGGFHGRVARWLEEHAGERIGEYLGLIAEHYIQAGERLRAAALLERSGAESLRIGGWTVGRGLLERALSLREEDGETESEAIIDAAINLGWADFRLGDYPAAESALMRGLAGARKLANLRAQAEALGWLGNMAQYRGNHDLARALLDEALPQARAVGGRTLALTLNHLAWLSWSLGELDIAERHATESLASARALGDAGADLLVMNMFALGSISLARDDFVQADRWHKAALELATRNGNLAQEGHLLTNIGHSAYRQNDFLKARTYYQAGQDRYRELGEQEAVALGLLNVGETNLRLGDHAAARREAHTGLALARAVGATAWALFGVQVFGEIAAVEGDLSRALACYGLVRAHPGLSYQLLKQVDEEIDRLDLPTAKVEAGLAAGAALDFDVVVEEILAGRW